MQRRKGKKYPSEFQIIARDLRKPSLGINEKKQRKIIKWETRNLFKKIRDTRGIFHEKMGTIKDTNGMELTELGDIKKRYEGYTEDYTKKIFMTQIITMV